MKKVAALMMAALIGVASAQDVRGPQAAPAATTVAGAQTEQWSVWGGELWFSWNRELLGDYGMTLSQPRDMLGQRVDGMQRFALREATGLDFSVKAGNFEGFRTGSIAMRGGYELSFGKQTVSLRDLRLVARKDDPFRLDLVSGDGQAWFYLDRLMYGLEKGGDTLELQAMDLLVSEKLAQALGDPAVAHMPVAGMRMHSFVYRGGFSEKGFSCPSSSKWPGMPAPAGQTYQADVFMDGFTMFYSRKSADANGPGGSDGLVVYTPSSTLRNNRNHGSSQATVPGDPMGTSVVQYAADVPWRRKFTDDCEPYRNDQHPYLIWNLYRIDALGRIEQVGRSGVKHAFTTINSGCIENPGTGAILGRGCGDTYGTGNNDSGGDLGPRREMIPASGQWGRCGSIYDPNCVSNDGDFAGYSSFDHRLQVRESKIDPGEPANSGATYRFESWYIVRDDVDIYNTMQTRTATFSWGSCAQGTCWNVVNGGALPLGPAIDQWVSPTTANPNQRNSEIANNGGHAKVAVKVTDLGSGLHRYDYAVMNFDFARAVTSGDEPDLRVLSNDGFVEFALPVAPSALTITNKEFSDGDTNAANDWTVTEEANRIVWTAPAGNRLNWGTLFRFSLTANADPIEANAALTTAQTSSVEVLTAESLVPQSEAVATYAVGGELTGLAAGESVSLQLNAETPILLDANDVFVFAGELLQGTAYAVSITAQPVTQNCTLDNESGTIDGADITDVLVTCVDLPPPVYSVSGSVSGLGSGRSVTLQLNGDESIVQADNGGFEFATLLGDETAYDVIATADAPDRLCSVTNGSGFVAGADVTGVQVVCAAAPTYAIGGAVSGLVNGASISLQLNGGETLVRSANSPFAFAGELLDGAAFAVTIVAQPVGMHCEIGGGDGNVDGADVDTIAVACVELSSHRVGGVLSGMPSGRSIALRLNGGPALVLSSSRSFTFTQTVFDGSNYDVTISSAPAGYGCSVANGTGSIDGADVDDVVVTCESLQPGVLVYGDGFE